MLTVRTVRLSYLVLPLPWHLPILSPTHTESSKAAE